MTNPGGPGRGVRRRPLDHQPLLAGACPSRSRGGVGPEWALPAGPRRRLLHHPPGLASARLAMRAEVLAQAGDSLHASHAAAAACVFGHWTTAVGPVLLLAPSACMTLARKHVLRPHIDNAGRRREVNRNLYHPAFAERPASRAVNRSHGQVLPLVRDKRDESGRRRLPLPHGARWRGREEAAAPLSGSWRPLAWSSACWPRPRGKPLRSCGHRG